MIVTQESGAYRLLKECDNGIYKSLVQGVDVRGKNDAPYFRDEDLKSVSDAIIQVAKDPQASRGKAAQLREALLNKGYTWAGCARQVIAALGWETSTPTEPEIVTPGEIFSDVPAPIVAAPPETDDLLEIPRPKWKPGLGLAVSQLLRAEEEAVPFDPNRSAFLAEQIEWAKNQEFPIAVRLIIGSGGAGKTRLALKFCQLLGEEGWWCGFFRGETESEPKIGALVERLKHGIKPTLVVIDYAETRTTDLVELLKPLVLVPPPAPLRIFR